MCVCLLVIGTTRHNIRPGHKTHPRNATKANKRTTTTTKKLFACFVFVCVCVSIQSQWQPLFNIRRWFQGLEWSVYSIFQGRVRKGFCVDPSACYSVVHSAVKWIYWMYKTCVWQKWMHIEIICRIVDMEKSKGRIVAVNVNFVDAILDVWGFSFECKRNVATHFRTYWIMLDAVG